MRRVVLAVTLALLAACAAHEKAGDRASSTGDWKTAEREYGQALKKDPGVQELRLKYREARSQALAEARRKARACNAARDWECTLAESQYVLGLEPGDAEMAPLRRDSGREAGRLRLRRAGVALERGESARAMELLEGARAATDDPAVEADARPLTRRAVQAAKESAERLRAGREYPQALDLLSRAARLDPEVAPQLRTVQAEYERWKDDEAERLARQGDELVDARRFEEAKARYDQAVAIRPMSRARDLSRYADLLVDGDREIARSQFSWAEASYERALETGLDRGFAREALDRVQIRRYAVRLLGVRVRRGGPPGDLVVSVTFPDGRRMQTPPERGAWARLDSSFVVSANAYDDRSVSATVLRMVERPHAPPLELGRVTFRLSDLLTRRILVLADGAVDELRVDVVPTDLPADGVRGLAPPLEPPRPPPPPRGGPERRR